MFVFMTVARMPLICHCCKQPCDPCRQSPPLSLPLLLPQSPWHPCRYYCQRLRYCPRPESRCSPCRQPPCHHCRKGPPLPSLYSSLPLSLSLPQAPWHPCRKPCCYYCRRLRYCLLPESRCSPCRNLAAAFTVSFIAAIAGNPVAILAGIPTVILTARQI